MYVGGDFLIFYSLLSHRQVHSSVKSVGEPYAPFTKTSTQRSLTKDRGCSGYSVNHVNSENIAAIKPKPENHHAPTQQFNR